MAGTLSIIQLCTTALFLSLCCFTLTNAYIGVCYGMNGRNLPPPDDVVALYKSNGISAIRLYYPDTGVLNALLDSGLVVMLGVRNEDIKSIAASPDTANRWVADYVLPYYPFVMLKYIVVGNEVIPGPLSSSVLPAIQNLFDALSRVNISLTVTTAVGVNVLAVVVPPSHGDFSSETADIMREIIKFITPRGGTLFLNVYPYVAYIGDPNHYPGAVPLDDVLFTSTEPTSKDRGLSYQNVFEELVDAVYAALEKAGGSTIRIAISESGWPSAGGQAATVENAQTYINNFIAHVQKKGTPRKPAPIEAFVFSMFNEDLNKPAGTENNFGLFFPNKQPVYNVTFNP